MPLPLLLVPLAVAGGSALAQTVAKLRSHRRLNEMRAELERLQSEHRGMLRMLYNRQAELCQRLGLPEPELPPALQEPEDGSANEPALPLWRRQLKRLVPQRRRRERTLAEGSPYSSRLKIIGRHGGSFAAGTVWRVWSASILNVLRPLGMNTVRPVATRALTFAPRMASAGGGMGGVGGSLAASTGLRFAVGAITAFGIVLGPALAAWSIFGEFKRIKRARRELTETGDQNRAELTRYVFQIRQLERQLAELPEPAPELAPEPALEPTPEREPAEERETAEPVGREAAVAAPR